LALSGSYPRFPKNLRCKKVSFEVSPTKEEDWLKLEVVDFRLKERTKSLPIMVFSLVIRTIQ
jgi:hypothetical protein